MAGRTVRRGAVLGLGALWWWAAVRLALAPDAGVLEGSVAAGGWGLSLLPVHCVDKARAVGAVAAGRWRAAWRGDAGGGESVGEEAGAGGGGSLEGGSGEGGEVAVGEVREGPTKAWPRRRSGGGSGLS